MINDPSSGAAMVATYCVEESPIASMVHVVSVDYGILKEHVGEVVPQTFADKTTGSPLVLRQ
jgi:hypothetical protein